VKVAEKILVDRATSAKKEGWLGREPISGRPTIRKPR
jgi:hypothetical protein